MTVISVNELEMLMKAALEHAGALPDSAHATACGIAYAEASGIVSHGLVRVPHLLDQLHSGKIDGRAVPSIVRHGVATLVDANHGLGYGAASTAVSAILSTLSVEPVAFALISRSHHFGVAGWYAERIALNGHIGVVCSGTVGAIAPVGGRHALLGNGPLAVSAPRAEGPPVVIDFAPAVSARGNIVAAAREENAIPGDWALDAEGRPTTDPETALQGTLRAVGGVKGVVLAMAIDVLIASLTTSLLPGDASSVFTPDGAPPELGHLLVALDPTALGVPNSPDKIERYLDALSSDGMRIPGDRRRINREEAARKGIEIPERLLDRLQRKV